MFSQVHRQEQTIATHKPCCTKRQHVSGSPPATAHTTVFITGSRSLEGRASERIQAEGAVTFSNFPPNKPTPPDFHKIWQLVLSLSSFLSLAATVCLKVVRPFLSCHPAFMASMRVMGNRWQLLAFECSRKQIFLSGLLLCIYVWMNLFVCLLASDA